MLNNKKRILYLGQKPLGEKCFEILLSHPGFEVIAAVSNAEIDTTWWKSNNVFKVCLEHGLPFLDNARRNEDELKEFISKYNVDYLISVQHPWILSATVLSLLNYRALNLHMAKLPDYKGWNGFSHAILNNDESYGSTIHWISDTLDHGDYAYKIEMPIETTDTAFSLYSRCIIESITLFRRMLDDLYEDNVPKYKQAEGGRLYKRNSLDQYRFIPFEKLDASAMSIIRALYFPPYPPPFTIIHGHKVALLPMEND